MTVVCVGTDVGGLPRVPTRLHRHIIGLVQLLANNFWPSDSRPDEKVGLFISFIISRSLSFTYFITATGFCVINYLLCSSLLLHLLFPPPSQQG